MSRLSIAISGLCLFAACNNDADGVRSYDAGADARAAGGAGGMTTPSTGGRTGSGGASATGGATGSGGAIATGGATSAGGSTPDAGATGGRSGSGGATASGGTATTGGRSGTGGRSTTGGTSGPATGGNTAGAGGSMATGGATAKGGATGTGGTTGTGGATAKGGATGTGGSTGGCDTPPAPSPLVGWAARASGGVTTTTGGGDAAPVTVTSLAELQNAVKGTNAAVIHVKGKLAAGSVSIGSNKTIVGTCGAEIHGHVSLSGSVNVIIRNIKLVGYAVGDCSKDPSYDSATGCSSGQDLITVQSDAHHIWFDHCDVSDGTDGNLDITNGADFVTISWTKFHYTPRTDNQGDDSTGAAGHRFSNLVGGSDSKTTDRGKLNVTWHHNWWADNVVERQPRVRFGKNHIFNNLYSSSASNYCVRAGIEAQVLLENNVFSGVKDAHEFNNSTDQGTAHITSTGNLYTNVSGEKATGGGGTPFTDPPYDYTLDVTASLQAAIQAGAGPK